MTKEQIKEFVESHPHIEDEELHYEIFDNPDYLTNYRLFRMDISDEEKIKAQKDMIAWHLRNYRSMQKQKGEKPRALAESLLLIEKSKKENQNEV